MKPFAIIFDMDGVIIDSNPYHKISLQQFCEKYGFHLSDEELISRIYGRTNKEWIPNLFGLLSKENLHKYEEEKEGLFRELFKHDIKALKGLPEFLAQCKLQKVPMAIGTSAPRSNVDFMLEHTGLGEYFPIILDETDVEHGKPNPEIYLKVAARLKFDPGQCIVFEDSLSGVEAAQRAGTKVVGVATTHSLEELSHTDFAIKDFENLDVVFLYNKIFRTN
jgi:HAD superfamily hydrolase (TIGR01509 family)